MQLMQVAGAFVLPLKDSYMSLIFILSKFQSEAIYFQVEDFQDT